MPQLSGGFNPTQAQSLAPYHLHSGTTKKGRTTYSKNLPLSSALSNSSANTVSLIPRRKLNLAKPMQLRITAASLTDTNGRMIDGNHDGPPGGDFAANLSKNKVTILLAAPAKTVIRTPAAAVDAALGDMRFKSGPRLIGHR
jgi:hypothetical protein